MICTRCNESVIAVDASGPERGRHGSEPIHIARPKRLSRCRDYLGAGEGFCAATGRSGPEALEQWGKAHEGSEGKPMSRDQIIESIGKELLGVATLETRNSDRLDFSDQSVWRLRRALEAAYDAGRAARLRRPPAPPTPPADVCIAGAPAVNGCCGTPGCVCATGDGTVVSSPRSWPCHSRPPAEWCDRDGPGDFMGHTCVE